jgi:predicted Fe-Mo cluster-binding NifX family protein
MIVAIATEENMVAQHFGRCPEYTLFTLVDGSVAEKKVIPNPGHEPGFLPGYLAKMGVNTIIAGGMGPRAQSLFENENIATIIGVDGPLQSVIEAYLAGELQSGPSTCEHGQGGHSCG